VQKAEKYVGGPRGLSECECRVAMTRRSHRASGEGTKITDDSLPQQ
jgi:hypothetical protein